LLQQRSPNALAGFERPVHFEARKRERKRKERKETGETIYLLLRRRSISTVHLPYKHLIGEYAKRPPVDRLVVSFALNYLRRQVLGCSTQRPRTVYTFNSQTYSSRHTQRQ